MQISNNGLQLIKVSEGFRSKVYTDVAGFATIGFGHKILPTDTFPVYGITEAQAEAVLLEDCSHIEFFLNSYSKEYNITLNQNQFDALGDFAFNLGVGSLHKLLSHGVAQVPEQIVLWTHAGGKVLEALLERRKKELALWLTPVNS